MRYIVKGNAPSQYLEWLAKANENWTPTYANLQNPEKQQLHSHLIAEQGYTCCYCGRRIGPTTSHIEHFRPQDAHQDLELSYENMHASCLRELSPSMPIHCGHAKSNLFDETSYISPLDIDCENRFLYSLDGGIHPAAAADTAAVTMREILKLDIPFLQKRRRETLFGIFDDDFLNSATPIELSVIIDGYQRKDENDVLSEFSHVVVTFASGLM
jgi:uncharacterized protein (TIGR02646 family)